MNTLKLYILTLIALSTTLIMITSTVIADENQTMARRLRDSGQILALEKIYVFAKAIKSGRILETELEKDNDQYIYEVELLDSNDQVWEIKLNAKTGKLIKLELED